MNTYSYYRVVETFNTDVTIASDFETLRDARSWQDGFEFGTGGIQSKIIESIYNSDNNLVSEKEIV